MSLVLSLGSINADFLAKVDAPISSPGTYPGRQLLRTSGGKAANVAVLTQRLGVAAKLVAVVGEDDLAAQALAGPEAEGVDVSVVTSTTGATGCAFIMVPPSGEKTIVRLANANDRWSDGGIAAVRAVTGSPEGTVVVLDLEISPAVALEAARTARARNLCLVLDPAPPELVDEEILRLVDHVTPDHREATAMTGIDSTDVAGAVEAARALHEAGGATAYVKLAEGGCAVCGAGDAFVVHPPAGVEAVDATGAGDAFAGGLAFAFSQGHGRTEATQIAVAAASCAVTRFGSQESYPSPEELQRMIERVRRANPHLC